MPDKLRVAVLFGGRSVEHEISVITALQLIAAIDPASYSVIPVYIAPNGSWFTGEQLLDRGFYKNVPSALDKLLEVSLLPKPGIGGLIKIDRGAGSSHQIIPVDLYLPVFHGQYGEDGCIQGLFELAQVPYTGCNVPASSITMNKYFCKMYLKQHNIPVLPAKMLARRKTQENLSEALQESPTLQS
jgi:D-alanine-D-alanine ligase